MVVITFLLVVASLQDCTGTRKEEMMNDFAPKAPRNVKLVLQNILANEVSLVRNQTFFWLSGMRSLLYINVWNFHLDPEGHLDFFEPCCYLVVWLVCCENSQTSIRNSNVGNMHMCMMITFAHLLEFLYFFVYIASSF